MQAEILKYAVTILGSFIPQKNDTEIHPVLKEGTINELKSGFKTQMFIGLIEKELKSSNLSAEAIEILKKFTNADPEDHDAFIQDLRLNQKFADAFGEIISEESANGDAITIRDFYERLREATANEDTLNYDPSTALDNQTSTEITIRLLKGIFGRYEAAYEFKISKDFPESVPEDQKELSLIVAQTAIGRLVSQAFDNNDAAEETFNVDPENIDALEKFDDTEQELLNLDSIDLDYLENDQEEHDTSKLLLKMNFGEEKSEALRNEYLTEVFLEAITNIPLLGTYLQQGWKKVWRRQDDANMTICEETNIEAKFGYEKIFLFDETNGTCGFLTDGLIDLLNATQDLVGTTGLSESVIIFDAGDVNKILRVEPHGFEFIKKLFGIDLR